MACVYSLAAPTNSLLCLKVSTAIFLLKAEKEQQEEEEEEITLLSPRLSRLGVFALYFCYETHPSLFVLFTRESPIDAGVFPGPRGPLPSMHSSRTSFHVLGWSLTAARHQTRDANQEDRIPGCVVS